MVDRPLLGEHVDFAAPIIADLGAVNSARLSWPSNRAKPQSKRPVELPSSADALRASHEDVPLDPEAASFRFCPSGLHRCRNEFTMELINHPAAGTRDEHAMTRTVAQPGLHFVHRARMSLLVPE